MSEEFQKTGVNTAMSKSGFTVIIRGVGGVLYRDSDGEILVDTEWLLHPFRILIYENMLTKLTEERRATILSNVVRACEFLGHRVEMWRDGRPDLPGLAP